MKFILVVFSLFNLRAAYGLEIGCAFVKLDPFKNLRAEAGHECASVDQVLKEFHRRYRMQNPDLAQSPEERKLAFDSLRVASVIKSEILRALAGNDSSRLRGPLQELIVSGEALSEKSLLYKFRRIRLDFTFSENEMLRGLAFLLKHELEVADHWGPGYSGLLLLTPELAGLGNQSEQALLKHYRWLQETTSRFLLTYDRSELKTAKPSVLFYVPRINSGEQPKDNLQFEQLKALSVRVKEQRACTDYGPEGDAIISLPAFQLNELIQDAEVGQSDLSLQLQRIQELALSLQQNSQNTAAQADLENATGIGDDINRALAQLDFDRRRLLRLSQEPRDFTAYMIKKLSLVPDDNYFFDRAIKALLTKICSSS